MESLYSNFKFGFSLCFSLLLVFKYQNQIIRLSCNHCIVTLTFGFTSVCILKCFSNVGFLKCVSVIRIKLSGYISVDFKMFFLLLLCWFLKCVPLLVIWLSGEHAITTQSQVKPFSYYYGAYHILGRKKCKKNVEFLSCPAICLVF